MHVSEVLWDTRAPHDDIEYLQTFWRFSLWPLILFEKVSIRTRKNFFLILLMASVIGNHSYY